MNVRTAWKRSFIIADKANEPSRTETHLETEDHNYWVVLQVMRETNAANFSVYMSSTTDIDRTSQTFVQLTVKRSGEPEIRLSSFRLDSPVLNFHVKVGYGPKAAFQHPQIVKIISGN